MRILLPILKEVPDHRKIITSSSDTNGHGTEVRRWLLVLNQGLGCRVEKENILDVPN